MSTSKFLHFIIPIFFSAMAFNSTASTSDTTKITIKIIETSDLHGNFFPYDFINQRAWNCGLAQIASYVEEQRRKFGEENVILLDNGDILQGQPTVYYYNFMDTTSIHIAASMMNHLRYDAATIGNHDIETGHPVYDRWIRQCDFPVLSANIIDTKSKRTYLPPYTIITRHGIKIAVLGLTTPGVPAWLPENLWKGLRFDDMEETAHKWVPLIIQKENPDLVVGLFHSGADNGHSTGKYAENASTLVAQNVAGFDIVLMGHDHRRANSSLTNIERRSVAVINPSSNGNFVGEATITFTKVNDKIIARDISTNLIAMKDYAPSETFMSSFHQNKNIIDKFVSRRIGYNTNTITSRDAYFGSSAFVDLIHTLQLNLSGADISMAAPLSFDATINKGDIVMSDMFNLYKYENMLYVMELSGKEIKNYLEMSYDLWINTIDSSDSDLMRIKFYDNGKTGFVNPTFNFDSAGGLLYTVDVTRPAGNRISIAGLANGEKFDEKRIYRVAINSYRGNGGGNLLTDGAKIPAEDLHKRIIWSTDIDLRYHLMKMIEEADTIDVKPLNHWKFIPEKIASEACRRNRAQLFND